MNGRPTYGWWKAPKIWQGDTVWIIGGGPSLKSKMHLLPHIHKKPTLGVNSAYKLGAWVDIMFFGDLKFFNWFYKELEEWPGLIVTNCDELLDREVGYVKFMKKQARGWSTDPGFCTWNTNSGAAACNLAYLLGAGRLILLGFDMKAQGNAHNWHDYNIAMEKAAKVHTTAEVHNKHLSFFRHVVQGAKSVGLEIINANPDSALEHFPKLTFEECLERYA